MEEGAHDTDSGVLRFPLLGFPVVVHPSFFVMGALLGMSSGGGAATVAGWLAITFVGVLWHELGHALVARAYGLSARIELATMGGLTYHDALPEARWGAELLITLAGPLMGLVLGVAVLIGARVFPAHDPFVVEIVRRLLWVNVGWSVINLLPVLPYDGGLALRALLSAMTSRAGLVAEMVTVVIGIAAAAVALFYRSYWAAYLAIAACVRSAGALLSRRRKQIMVRAWELVMEGRSDAAIASVRSLVAPSDRDEERAGAVELTSWAFLYDGDASTARQRLQHMPERLQGSSLLQATLDLVEGTPASLVGIDPTLILAMWPPLAQRWIDAGQAALLQRLLSPTTIGELAPVVVQRIDASLFHAGDYVRAVDLAIASYAVHKQPNDAYNAACSYARLGDTESGIMWLETAIANGFDDIEGMRKDEDLVSLRDDPRFVAILSRMGAS